MKPSVIASRVIVPRKDGAPLQICCFGDNNHTHPVAVVNRDPRDDLSVPSALARKIDRFAALALKACKDLVQHLPPGNDPARVGVFVGNQLGGWAYGEVQLEKLYCEGPRAVHPYQATAWFPAAAQGEVSISLGLMGCSKTVSGGCLCGAEAILLALDALQNDEIDYALAGGAESPVSSFGLWGLAGGCPPPGVCYGEGAAFLLLARTGKGDQPKIALSPLQFHPTDRDWYEVVMDNVPSTPPHSFRIPAVDPVLDIIAGLRRAKQEPVVQLTQRAGSGQGYVVTIERGNDV